MQTCDIQYLIRLKICAQAACQKSFASSPIMILPLVSAAFLMIYLSVHDFLNTQGSKCRTLCISLLVVCAIGDPLQRLALTMWYLVAEHSNASKTNDRDAPEFARAEPKTTGLYDSTIGRNKSCLASDSAHEKENY
jgi:hypothetical protein